MEEKVYQELNIQLSNSFREYRYKEDDSKFILDAFGYAFKKHLPQKRKSGEMYIIHPVAVAQNLLSLKCDKETVAAGLLHDVVEDTDTEIEEIDKCFGPEVARIVDAVTKIGKLHFKSTEEAQASNFRKMLIAIAQDMRVVLVKLADRLNNMQTLQHLKEEKQRRIAKETLDIFAPLANRFGLHNFQVELEDLALKYYYKDEFTCIKEIVNSKKHERETQLDLLAEKIEKILEENLIEAKIKGRAKHFYSIYKKLVSKKFNFACPESAQSIPIYDLLGIRMLVSSVKDCYAALGVIHDTFRPMPGRFKDYIAMPKSNMYQSLHTTVIIPWDKRPLEVQIRTHEMNEIAENGIAAHWFYKQSGGSNKIEQNKSNRTNAIWLKQLASWHKDVDESVQDAEEYYSTVKDDVLSLEVYILTPKGDVVVLPDGSTPVDFAYKIHTRVGDTCVGAIVNEKMIGIDYTLNNGDMVEIVTSKTANPNMSWLNFVKTHQAKHRIKSWYKKQNHERHTSIGAQILADKYTKNKAEEIIKSEEFLQVANNLNYQTAEDLLAGIGSGDNTIIQIVHRLENLKSTSEDKEPEDKKLRKIKAKANLLNQRPDEKANIPELDGLLYSIAKCCLPIPGEDVIGTVTKGRGIMIHRRGCNNIKSIPEERLMELNWRNKEGKRYPAQVCIEVVDRVGMVKDILSLIADEGINIRDFKVNDRPTLNSAILKATIEVLDETQLKKVSNQIDSIPDVLNVFRI